MKVLITGLFTQGAIFAIRRFAKEGFEITGADSHRLAYGFYSKYVKKKLLLPRIMSNPTGFAEGIIKELKKNKYEYFFPSFEEIFLLSKYRDEILSLTKTVIPSHDEIFSLHDKSLLNKTIEKAKVDLPATFIPNSYSEAREIISKIDGPVFIKLRQSRNSGGLVYVGNPKNIKYLYVNLIKRQKLDENELPIIQKLIQGKLICSLEITQKGKIVGEIMCKAIRMVPRKGGTTVARESVNIDICNIASEKIVNCLNYTGFIGFDYIYDEKAHKAYVIDCNPRCSVIINLAYHAEIDMIKQWMQIANDEKAKPSSPVKNNVKTKTHFAELFWFIDTYWKGPETWKERKTLRAEYKKDKGYFYDVMDKNDLLPTFLIYLFLFSQSVKLLYTNLEPSQLFLYYNNYSECLLENNKKGE